MEEEKTKSPMFLHFSLKACSPLKNFLLKVNFFRKKKTTTTHSGTFRKVRRPKTALSPKRIAFCLQWIKSYTPTSSLARWETRITCRTSDCSDSHFPTNKGPKYLQYSNSLNNTFILCFIQLLWATSSMF